MATYKEIKGVTVQTLDSDPVVGGVAGGSWASSTSLNSARTGLAPAQAGTQTAALAFGGEEPPGNSAKTESWNGSAWTETGDLTAARQSLAGAGTYTAALAIGGLSSAADVKTGKFNGSSWTETGDLNLSLIHI